MPKFNDLIELSVEDMALIEQALRREKHALTTEAYDGQGGDRSDIEAVGTSVRRIHDLLGRLHNQKVFYRPTAAPYVSG